jgi:hypothetical protein
LEEISLFPRLVALSFILLLASAVSASAADVDAMASATRDQTMPTRPFIRATEICNGVDDNCAGGIDELVDDPVDGLNNDGDFSPGGVALIDEGFGFCVVQHFSGPRHLRNRGTLGLSVAGGSVPSDVPGFGT